MPNFGMNIRRKLLWCTGWIRTRASRTRRAQPWRPRTDESGNFFLKKTFIFSKCMRGNSCFLLIKRSGVRGRGLNLPVQPVRVPKEGNADFRQGKAVGYSAKFFCRPLISFRNFRSWSGEKIKLPPSVVGSPFPLVIPAPEQLLSCFDSRFFSKKKRTDFVQGPAALTKSPN